MDRSRQEFQRLMDLLSKRSAGMHPPPAPPRPEATRREPGWDWEPVPPARPARWEPEEERWRPPRRERERERARYPAWPPHSLRCRRAGVPVEGSGWYVVAPGDTLWTIAETHYGDGRAWQRIVEANRRRLPDPSCIYVCQRIYIPRRGRERPEGISRREREWPDDARPGPRQDEGPWVRSAPQTRPVEPVSVGPRGCEECGAGSHVSASRGDRRDDREWR